MKEETTFRKVRLASDNLAVFEVEARHAPQGSWVIAYGKHIATNYNGTWFVTGLHRVADRRYAEMLDQTESVV